MISSVLALLHWGCQGDMQMEKDLGSRGKEAWLPQILAETLAGSVNPGQVVSSWFPCLSNRNRAICYIHFQAV